MKTDLYTKAVLTVIAVCLAIIVFKQVGFMPCALANSTVSDLNYGLVPLNANGTIDVNIKSSSAKLNVNIVDINTATKLNVSLLKVEPFAFFSCTVPVKMK